jgi:hypothetical protein
MVRQTISWGPFCMRFASSARRSLVLVAAVASVALAGSAESRPRKAPPPPPPPPPPAVSLSPKLVEQASAYRAYVARATSISPAFANGQDVAQGLRTGAAYQPDQLMRGAVVYGAIAALQEPTFVAGVRTYVNDPDQRRTIAYAIMKDPAYALGMNGSAAAAGLVIAALNEDGRKLLDQGRAVKQAAYDVQHSPWSKAEVPARVARLELAKQLSSQPLTGEANETTRLEQASIGQGALGVAGATAAPPYTPLVVRSLAVAALAALGYADDQSLEQVLPLLAEPATGTCLNLAKLNLYQCLAVAKPHYEDVFCLGTHALEETGACLIKASGVTVPPDPRVEAAKAARAAQAAAKLSKASAKRRPAHHGRR